MANMVDVINKHLDIKESYNSQIKDEIKKVFDKLDIKEIINKPDTTLEVFKLAMIKLLNDRYLPVVVNESVRYAKDVLNQG